MSWFSIFNKETGELFSHCEEVADNLNPELDFIEDGPERMDQTRNWDPESRSWSEAVVANRVTVAQLMKRFTTAERLAYFGNTSAGVGVVEKAIDFHSKSGVKIDLAAPETGQMLDLLVAEGIITAVRKAEILA